VKVSVNCESKKVFTPEQKEVGKELKEAIQRAMLKLSKKQAQAIALFGIEDLPRDEVAEIMGCSAEAVRWHVFKARQKLRVLLKEYLE
jgi:RNA polymerase sigma factor (sigma-70 family)